MLGHYTNGALIAAPAAYGRQACRTGLLIAYGYTGKASNPALSLMPSMMFMF